MRILLDIWSKLHLRGISIINVGVVGKDETRREKISETLDLSRGIFIRFTTYGN